jgi:hypothetical protein
MQSVTLFGKLLNVVLIASFAASPSIKARNIMVVSLQLIK